MEKRDIQVGGELQHWGIRGMRWGIRRYQNKDGSLTPAGEKRRAKLEKKLGDLQSKSDNNTGTGKTEPTKKSIKDMSNDELKKLNERRRLEKESRDLDEAELRNTVNTKNLQKQLDDMNPKKDSKLKKYGEKAVDAAVEASVNAGKTVLQEFLIKQGKEAFQLNPQEKKKSKLEKQVEELGLLSKKAGTLRGIFGVGGFDPALVTDEADKILGTKGGFIP